MEHYIYLVLYEFQFHPVLASRGLAEPANKQRIITLVRLHSYSSAQAFNFTFSPFSLFVLGVDGRLRGNCKLSRSRLSVHY